MPASTDKADDTAEVEPDNATDPRDTPCRIGHRCCQRNRLADVFQPGYWLAYYADWSGFRAFSSELDALRYAVEFSMCVKHVPWGADPTKEAR